MSTTIDKIVKTEWEMFQKVNENGPSAPCQNNWKTFEGMRRGQFQAWSQRAQESYAADLGAAAATGRNLVEEKYIRMMEQTDPQQYAFLKEYLPALSQQQYSLASEVNQMLLSQAEAVFAQFPHIAAYGRPLHTVQDSVAETSVETYQMGELLTYSEETLLALREHLLSLAENGQALFRLTFENSVKFYGFKSLEEAEEIAVELAHTADSSAESSKGDTP